MVVVESRLTDEEAEGGVISKRGTISATFTDPSARQGHLLILRISELN